MVHQVSMFLTLAQDHGTNSLSHFNRSKPMSSAKQIHTDSAIKPKVASYIAVEGCIGVGKTTLSSSLAKRIGGRNLLELVEENPFLPDFYKDPSAHAFKTQIFFLLSRYKQQQALKQRDLFSETIVADYIMQKDRIFAELTLNGSELLLYNQFFSTLCEKIQLPDIIIYLRAPLDIVCERIKSRGRNFEKHIDQNYLSDLMASYDTFFAGFSDCPVLIVETEELNFPEKQEDITYVIDAMAATLSQGKSKHLVRKGELRQPTLFNELEHLTC